ncbi:hypothetical protein [Intestinimonas butyriciproducens]|uniref:hypothetical protein n=1 Tax=Intestinimonas butyriciproducens TaxID=1297617 RepID=UPI00195CE08D|nr:hypothetical protein [Intestinimonas butyriciproducens]MBM6977499.1 hypothetical protein [Intestinimonas butyriciproducens]
MKGMWKSAKWEFLESELSRWQSLYFVGLGLINSYNAALNMYGGWVVYPLLSIHLITFIIVAAYRGMKWPFTGAFDLERTSGRPAWQSVLGRTLLWTVVIALGTALQQVFLRVCLDRFERVWVRIFSDGAQRAARIEDWIGWRPFLAVMAAGVGVYVLSLTVTLLCKSGKKGHRATLSGAVGSVLAACILGGFLLQVAPLGLLGLGCILVGLPLSIWLLARKVE